MTASRDLVLRLLCTCALAATVQSVGAYERDDRGRYQQQLGGSKHHQPQNRSRVLGSRRSIERDQRGQGRSDNRQRPDSNYRNDGYRQGERRAGGDRRQRDQRGQQRGNDRQWGYGYGQYRGGRDQRQPPQRGYAEGNQRYRTNPPGAYQPPPGYHSGSSSANPGYNPGYGHGYQQGQPTYRPRYDGGRELKRSPRTPSPLRREQRRW